MASPDTIIFVDSEIEVRRWRDEDAVPISHHGSNPNVWATLSDRMPHPYTVEDARDWIAHTRRAETQVMSGHLLEDPTGPRIPASYVIVVNGEPCGTVGLEFGSGVYRLGATIGYWLGEAYHSRGIMSRAIPAFVEWTWRAFGYLIRLNATAYRTNTRSQKVLQKAGFALESTRINGCIKNGVILDEVTLGALRPAAV